MTPPTTGTAGDLTSAATTQAAIAIRTVAIDGQVLRIGIRAGSAPVPLLIFNGIGANLELMAPFAAALDGIECVVFDVPGVGGSPAPTLPYRLKGLAQLADRLMTQLGYGGWIDVLGISWGGTLAQQFAFTHPRRCRRLVLAATSPGSLMVPGKLSVLSKMINPRRYHDPTFLQDVGAQLYGGELRRRPELLHEHGQHMKPPLGRGYLYQLLAGTAWSSLPWLRRLRQPTLVMAGSDDPIIPLVNARILATLIRDARLHVVDDGHLFLLTRAPEMGRVVKEFLSDDAASAGSPLPSIAATGHEAA